MPIKSMSSWCTEYVFVNTSISILQKMEKTVCTRILELNPS